LGGKPDILATAADRQRQLVFADHDLDALGFLVEHDLGHFRRLQRVHDERGGVRRPWDDVDALALKLANDRLNTAAAHADAGAYGVDGRVPRHHGDLGARTRVAGDGFDCDDPVVDLRHLHGEKLRHELGMGARHEDLRPRCSRRTS
jgi:hypothetical protein